jgi:hypothetical protein
MISALGSGEPGMRLRKQKEPGMHTLVYKAEKKSDLMMLVSDHVGTLLFWDLIVNSDGFMRTLNFKFIAPGTYSIDVIDINGINSGESGESRANQKLDHQMPVLKLDSLML